MFYKFMLLNVSFYRNTFVPLTVYFASLAISKTDAYRNALSQHLPVPSTYTILKPGHSMLHELGVG
jgi:hypothetical protein